MENFRDKAKETAIIGYCEVSVQCEQKEIAEFEELLFEKSEIFIKNSAKTSSTMSQVSGVGQQVWVQASYLQMNIEISSVISKRIGHFFLLDFPFLPISGTVLSFNKKCIIGFLVPIKVPHNFSVGLALHYFLPTNLTVPYVPNRYPVHPVFSYAQGSAVSIGNSLIITSGHVVSTSQSASMLYFSKKHSKNSKVLGKVLKKGLVLDLAVVKIEKKLKVATLAQKFFEGENVFCVGYCFGGIQEPVITHGCLNKIVYYHGFPVFAMISAKTFNGQSGGGVFNEQHELIGIITANAHNENDCIYEDLGFCILNTVFLKAKVQNFNYLWEEQTEDFAALFTFQTTSSLPSPKI